MPAATETTACPGCAVKVRYAVGLAGRRVRCRCGAVAMLPEAGPVLVDLLAKARASVRPVVATRTQPAHDQPNPPVRFLRVGVACPFAVGSTVPVNHTGRDRFAAGCFDRYLRRVECGIAAVRLWVDHDPAEELGSTANGDLMVWADADAVFIALLTPRIVAAVDRYPDRTALSVGASPTRERQGSDAAGPLMDVLESDLVEISLTRWGALPGNGWLTKGRAVTKCDRLTPSPARRPRAPEAWASRRYDRPRR